MRLPRDIRFNIAAAIIFVIAGLLIVTACRHPLRITPDAAVHVQCAKMLLSGKMLYVDFFDQDPPLLSYLSLPAAAYAAAMHVNPCLPYQLFVCLCVVFCGVQLIALLAAAQQTKESYWHPFFLTAFALFNLLIGPEFGCSEHLLVLFCLPFIIVRWLRMTGQSIDSRLASLAGVGAAIGFNLDWLFLAFPISLEFFNSIYFKRKAGTKAPELVSLGIGTAAYLLHFLFLNRAEIYNYFYMIWPISNALANVFDPNLGFVTKSPDRRDVICLILCAFLAAFWLRKRISMMLPLCVFALTGLEVFVYRSQGFSHELVPLIFSLTAIGMLSLAGVLNYGQIRLAVPALVALRIGGVVISGVSALAVAGFILCRSNLFDLHDLKTGAALDEPTPFAHRIAAITKPGDQVMFINPFQRPGYPLTLQLGLEPGSKWLYFFPIRLFIKLEAQQGSPFRWLLKYKKPIYEELKKEIVDNDPQIVALQSGETDFEIEKDPEFMELVKDRKVAEELTLVPYQERINTTQHRIEMVGDQFTFALYVKRE